MAVLRISFILDEQFNFDKIFIIVCLKRDGTFYTYRRIWYQRLFTNVHEYYYNVVFAIMCKNNAIV